MTALLTILDILGALWSLPNTLVALLLVLVGRASFVRREGVALIFQTLPGGLIDGWMTGGGFGGVVGSQVAAATCGVVVVMQPKYLSSAQMVKHETRHVLQGFVLGVLHGPAYLVGMLVALFRGQSVYHDNWFEADARSYAGEK